MSGSLSYKKSIPQLSPMSFKTEKEMNDDMMFLFLNI